MSDVIVKVAASDEIDFFECPVCGEGLKSSSSETEDDHAHWIFRCGAEILRMDGKFWAEEPCESALQEALDRINAQHAKAEQS